MTVSAKSVGECLLFRSFTEEEKELLSSMVDRVVFPVGKLLFDQDDEANAFFFLKSGRVGLYRKDNFGRWNKVAVVRGGTPLGECAFLLNKKHSLRAVAEREVIAFEISRENFERLKEEHPLTALKLLRLLVEILSLRLKEEDRRYAGICGFFNTPGGGGWRR